MKNHAKTCSDSPCGYPCRFCFSGVTDRMALSPDEHFLVVAFEIINSAIENVVDLANTFSYVGKKSQGHGSRSRAGGLLLQ